ncbi:MAG: hypothetical protein KBT22_05120 [Bacteroidales bacterium]|nr:hypothetical protein [Candidatus Scybalocola fimicaballi]
MKVIKLISNIAAACLLLSFASCNNVKKDSKTEAQTEEASNLSKFDGFDILVPEDYQVTTYPFPSIPLVLEKGDDIMIDVTKANTQEDFKTFAENLLNSDSQEYPEFRLIEISKQEGVYEFIFSAKTDEEEFTKISRLVDAKDGLIYRVNGDILPGRKDTVVAIVRSFRPTDFKVNTKMIEKISEMAEQESQKIENENNETAEK